MKRLLTVFAMSIMVVLGSGIVGSQSMAFAAGGIPIYVDGERLELDAAPFIENNRTMVPIRGVFEKLGAVVDWNKETRQVIIKNDLVEVTMETDNKAVLLNGQVRFLDTATLLYQDRAYVPIRFVAESLGCTVSWDAASRSVMIVTNPDGAATSDSLPVLGSAQALVQLLNYNDQLSSYITGSYRTLDDGAVGVDTAVPEVTESKSEESAPSSEGMEAPAAVADEYSGTNNQVSGVEEGDIVKTDGINIYTYNNNVLTIIRADAQNPSILSQITVDASKGYLSDLYVQGDKLVLIGNQYGYYYGYPMPVIESIAPATEEGVPVMADEMMMPPAMTTQTTFVLVYDITDPEKPELEQDYSFEGNYLSSRMIGDQFYMVTQKDFNTWIYQPYLDKSVTVLDDSAEQLAKPRYADNMTDEVTVIDYDEIRYFPDQIQPSYMLTVGLDLSDQRLEVQAYLGRAESVYASTENLYLTLTRYSYEISKELSDYLPNYEKSTSVYKFALEDASIDYASKGRVPGTIRNQFSLDEYNGNLRIATTTGETWDPTNPSENNLFVLDEDLDQIGKLTGLAEGESIYSTRFAGDRIYMVTFRQIDPFYVIDASDPENPKVLGYLKIPGFSTYMHILDEGHILGFGYETQGDENAITRGGFKLSLFDVTNPSAPVELDKEVIGTSGTYSELENNHKALMISLDKGYMAFPITVASQTPYSTDFTGAYVYEVSTSAFDFHGLITHHTNETVNDSYGYKYYDYNYNISRVIYIGEYFYSLSPAKLEVHRISDMVKTGEVELIK